jgi:hypothetical protein
MACYELCSLTVADKHPNIIIHTLLLLNRIIKSDANIRMPSGGYQPQQFITDQIVSTLIAFFVDTNQKIR